MSQVPYVNTISVLLPNVTTHVGTARFIVATTTIFARTGWWMVHPTIGIILAMSPTVLNQDTRQKMGVVIHYCQYHRCIIDGCRNQRLWERSCCLHHICYFEQCGNDGVHCSLNNGAICQNHTCITNNCFQPKWKGSHHCYHHKCTASECTHEKYSTSDYCLRHYCVVKHCPYQRDSTSLLFCSRHQCNSSGCDREGCFKGYCYLHQLDCYQPTLPLSHLCLDH